MMNGRFDDFDLFETCEEYYNVDDFDITLSLEDEEELTALFG